jgi:two-component system, LytTR family, sensor kinase
MVDLFLCIGNLFLVYFNIHFLVKEYFTRDKVTHYLLFTVLSILAMAIVNTCFYQWATIDAIVFRLSFWVRVAENAVFSASLLGTALAFHLLKRFLVSQSRLRLAESAQLQTELNFLKSQINPHFLFNALNNIQVQLNVHPKDASESIGHLSALLRYQLYDSARDKVQLRDEVEFLQNFLRINDMRTGGAPIDFLINGEMDGIKVTPYLFIPFVENAVKHSRGIGGNLMIRIKMEIVGPEILFEIENGKPLLVSKKEASGGIGMVNICRRLDLLYNGRYYLEINNGHSAYSVKLKLRY